MSQSPPSRKKHNTFRLGGTRIQGPQAGGHGTQGSADAVSAMSLAIGLLFRCPCLFGTKYQQSTSKVPAKYQQSTYVIIIIIIIIRYYKMGTPVFLVQTMCKPRVCSSEVHKEHRGWAWWNSWKRARASEIQPIQPWIDAPDLGPADCRSSSRQVPSVSRKTIYP